MAGPNNTGQTFTSMNCVKSSTMRAIGTFGKGRTGIGQLRHARMMSEDEEGAKSDWEAYISEGNSGRLVTADVWTMTQHAAI